MLPLNPNTVNFFVDMHNPFQDIELESAFNASLHSTVSFPDVFEHVSNSTKSKLAGGLGRASETESDFSLTPLTDDPPSPSPLRNDLLKIAVTKGSILSLPSGPMTALPQSMTALPQSMTALPQSLPTIQRPKVDITEYMPKKSSRKRRPYCARGTTSPESRKRKHRATDKERRRRIKSGMETLKGIVASPEAKLDHATTIECAIHMIKTLRDEVKAADKPSTLSKGFINALDGIQISCWNISSSGVILDVNETAAKFAGFTRREMLNRNSSELINARFYVKGSFEDRPPITATLQDIYRSLMIQDHLMVTFTLIDKSGDYW